MIKIEFIQPEETSRFKVIRLRSLLEAPDAFGSTYEKALTWDDKNWMDQVRKLPTVIACDGSHDLGVARIVKDENDPTHAWIISMWLAPEGRGKGVGSKLIEAMIDWAKQNQIDKIKLHVVDSNIPAIKLYEKFGFLKNGNTGHFPEPRTQITEHERELDL